MQIRGATTAPPARYLSKLPLTATGTRVSGDQTDISNVKLFPSSCMSKRTSSSAQTLSATKGECGSGPRQASAENQADGGLQSDPYSLHQKSAGLRRGFTNHVSVWSSWPEGCKLEESLPPNHPTFAPPVPIKNTLGFCPSQKFTKQFDVGCGTPGRSVRPWDRGYGGARNGMCTRKFRPSSEPPSVRFLASKV